MAKSIEDILGKGQDLEERQKDPMSATPDGEGEEGSPLERLDRISKAKPQKNKGKDASLDEDVVLGMMKTGDNSDGMFEPKEEGEHEPEAKEAKVSLGKQVEPQGKYEASFKDDMLKHPNEYKINTPRGEMTVAEAMRAGYDPITKRFSKEHGQDRLKEKHLSRLNDADRAGIEALTDPSAAQIAPADAEAYGVPQDSPMVKGNRPAQPPMDMSGAMPGNETPLGGALPGSNESMAPGATDISALLGGNQQ